MDGLARFLHQSAVAMRGGSLSLSKGDTLDRGGRRADTAAKGGATSW